MDALPLTPAIAAKPHLLDPAILEGLEGWLKERGQGAFRAGQIRRWLFESRISSFEEMTLSLIHI